MSRLMEIGSGLSRVGNIGASWRDPEGAVIDSAAKETEQSCANRACVMGVTSVQYTARDPE